MRAQKYLTLRGGTGLATLIPSIGTFAFDSSGTAQIPVENRLDLGDFDPTSNKIKGMTMKVSKGLEFPVVALPGVGHMPAAGDDEKEAARVFYVAATRATQRLVMGVEGDGGFGSRLCLSGTQTT